jgi:hypothetical protein
METNSDSQNDAQRGDQNPLPVTRPTVKTVEASSVDPLIPSGEQNEVLADLKQKHGYRHGTNVKHPFFIKAVESREFSHFEKRTILFGFLGLAIGFLSLVAACIAGYFVYHQWWEMNAQTGYMNRATKQARADSAASTVAIAKQLAIMQGQLTQAQYAARLDQRAWIEFEPIKPKPYKDSTELHTYELFPRNVGKTAARNIVVRADNATQNREGIENTKHPEWIHNMQDKYLFGKFKNSPPLNGGTPVPSVLGPNTVSPIPITYIEQSPQVFPSGFSVVSEIVGRIDYVDEFGVPHWIRFCFYTSDAAGNLASCAAGNDEDRNPEISSPLPTQKPN